MLELALTTTLTEHEHDWLHTLMQLLFGCVPFALVGLLLGYIIWAVAAGRRQQRAVAESIEFQRQAKGWHEESAALAREQIRLLRKLANESEPSPKHERLTPPTEPM